MPELLGLAELKKRAKAAGYTKISRLADPGRAVPLDSWHGFAAETGSGSVHVGFIHIEWQHRDYSPKWARLTSSSVCPNLNGAVKALTLLQTLEKYFPECYTRFLGAGSLLEL